MKLVRTIVFILLFAAVVAIYLFQARLAKQTLTIVPDEVNRTVVITPEDPVDRVELRDSIQKTELTLRKENGGWVLERPVRYPAEGAIAEGFVIAARMASRLPRLQAEKEWGEYGLAKPDLEVRFDLPGKRTATLQIGAEAPVGKAVFARWTDERGFFLLPKEMKAMFRQSVYALRQKRLFRQPADKMRKIFVEMGEHSYEWKKDDPPEKQDEARPSSQGGRDWYWLEPVGRLGQKISPERIGLVQQSLQNLYVKEFLDDNKKSKAELGFFLIHDRIWIEYEDGKKEVFYFGNEVPEQNAYYGFLEGEDAIFFVDRAKVIQLLDLLQNVEKETEDRRPETGDNRVPHSVVSVPQGEGK